jgi:hypothetical protein
MFTNSGFEIDSFYTDDLLRRLPFYKVISTAEDIGDKGTRFTVAEYCTWRNPPVI